MTDNPEGGQGMADDTRVAPKIAQRSAQEAGMTGCSRCPNRWGGLSTAHCAACHRTFTGITAFDKHRDGSHVLSTRSCVAPESVGLEDAGRAYPCWGFPRGDWTPGFEAPAPARKYPHTSWRSIAAARAAKEKNR